MSDGMTDTRSQTGAPGYRNAGHGVAEHFTEAKYVDKTGTDQKPNPMRDVFLEFPHAMLAVAEVTAFGAKKHAPRGWRTFEHKYGMDYSLSKIGRHLLKLETEGPVNAEDGGLLHMAQVAWNALAYLDHYLRQLKEEAGLLPANAVDMRGKYP